MSLERQRNLEAWLATAQGFWGKDQQPTDNPPTEMPNKINS
jgi:hypothetical protein